MLHKFDLIIIGSGPAGSASALTAAAAGLSVALLDKAAFPRDKLCGGGVTGRAARYMHDVFGLAPDSDLFCTSDRFRLACDGRIVTCQDNTPPIHMTMRHNFDARLHRMAVAAGAQVFAPVRIATLDPSTATVTLSDGRQLQAALLIGADGANSVVARTVFGRAFDPLRIGFGLEVELDRDLFPDTPTEIDLGAADWGYGWVFPKHGSVTLGVGGLHARNPDMTGHFHRYLARHVPAAHRLESIRCKGAFLPFGTYHATPGAGRVLLAGDAAGLVDPITGEGIGWALRSGQFAGQTAVAALAAGRPDTALAAYKARLAYIHREIDAARRIRALIYARPVKALFPRTVARHPTMSRTYLRLLAGEMDYADLGPRAIFRLARRIGGSLLPARPA